MSKEPAAAKSTPWLRTDTFTSDLFGDSGTWSGGGATITVTWTAGQDNTLVFTGTFTKTPRREYKGSFDTGFGAVFVESRSFLQGADLLTV